MKTFSGYQEFHRPSGAQTSKVISFVSNITEGQLRINLERSWSEYTPEQVRKMMASMQEWLDSLIPWQCEHCDNLNYTAINGPFTVGWSFVRCHKCTRKTKFSQLGLTKTVTSI